MAKLVLLAACAAGAAAVGVGDKFPSVVLDYGFPPEKISLSERLAGKKVILVGLPGAFTPTWSTRQVPGYKEATQDLKALGIDEVVVYCVNDGAVMDAWAENQGVPKGGLITLMGDPSGAVTSALGMELTHPGPMSKLGYTRSKRFALYIVDGVVKIVRVAEKGPMGQEDPAGDDYPEVTLAPAMIEAIKALGNKDEV